MKPLFVLLIVVSLLCPVVFAQNVSFASPDSTAQKDIYLYSGNGSLIGLYNTTSTGIAIPNNTDLLFVLKPQYENPLDNPSDWLDSSFAYVETNLIPLLIIIFLIGILLSRR